MSTADTTATADTCRRGQTRSAVSSGPLPPECDPNRHLDWRFRYALHLVRNSSQLPITHEDPWIQTAVDCFIAHESAWENRKPTLVDQSIAAAIDTWKNDSLAKHLLEARLLAQEEPQEIYERCHLSMLTILAYSRLLFDVCGVDRKGIWLLHPLSNGALADSEVGQFGLALKQTACFQTSEDLEDRINLLCRLDGKTLADGLPARTEPEFVRELGVRQALATPLLPSTRPMEKLLQRFEEAAQRDLLAGRSSSESIDLAVEILRKAKIPTALRKEIQRVRELCSEAAALVATVEPPGTVAGVDH